MSYEILKREFIIPELSSGMCHASTVLPLADGSVLAAWFGGSHEGKGDTAIWLSRREGCWERPMRLAYSEEAHWNPVLRDAGENQIVLYFKVGDVIAKWRTMFCVSADGGRTWSDPQELVEGDRGGRGPVRNKILELMSGRLLAPASIEDGIWRAFADISDDEGRSWQKSTEVQIENLQFKAGERTDRGSGIEVSEQSFYGRGVIQPTLWESSAGRVHMLLRSTEGAVYRSDSEDGGKTWSAARRTALPNNNSGIDLTRTEDGALYLACNPVGVNWGPRTPMSLLRSGDNGENWERLLDLDGGEGEFSYPAVVAGGSVLHVTYSWKRRTIAYWQIGIAPLK
ncbi:sialidase family protein [Caproicibacter sp.]|uniref:sialidase family protein n=1 Tax=Caproicibacter sp. TaxID=2814884 RepID=UPI00398A33DF